MNILEEIVAYKKEQTKIEKAEVKIAELEKSDGYQRKVFSLSEKLSSATDYGIIAEYKRKSPSKGLINGILPVDEVVKEYQEAGASAISVLTDHKYFGGSSLDFQQARACLNIPLLRKDFIVNEYQVHQTKSMGADIMLLIAAALSENELVMLAKTAKSIGLEVLFEIHAEEELNENVLEYVDIVGVNNRNLKTFKTSIDNSIKLSEKIPESMLKISESGISDKSDITELVSYGYNGFLIGEQFMKSKNPGLELKSFLS